MLEVSEVTVVNFLLRFQKCLVNNNGGMEYVCVS